MWFIPAALSAVFAALTSVLAKIGLGGVNSTLATAIRTGIVLVMSWVMVFISGTQSQVPTIPAKSWVFLVLSGLATGASWLCYYKALTMGETAKVVTVDKFSLIITIVLAAVLLHEHIGVKEIIGGILITAGTIVMVF